MAADARRSASVRKLQLRGKVDCTFERINDPVPFCEAYAAVMIIDWYVRCKRHNRWMVGCQVEHKFFGHGVLEATNFGTAEPYIVRFEATRAKTHSFALDRVVELTISKGRELSPNFTSRNFIRRAMQRGVGISAHHVGSFAQSHTASGSAATDHAGRHELEFAVAGTGEQSPDSRSSHSAGSPLRPYLYRAMTIHGHKYIGPDV